MSEILFLSLEDVVAAGGNDMPAAIADVKHAVALYDTGKVVSPPKTTLREGLITQEGELGLVNVLPAAILDEPAVFGAKLMGSMSANLPQDIPRATGVICLFDRDTKMPIAIMDAQVISAMRTGAISALMAAATAPRGTTSVGLIGAGVNMRTQLLGLATVLPNLATVRVFSRGRSKEAFAREMGERLGLAITPVDSAEEAMAGQRLVVTCIANAPTPVAAARWLSSGVTLFNIGGNEVEPKALAGMDRIIADNWEIAKHRASQSHATAYLQGIIKDDQVEDMAPIILGRRPGRTSPDENIFFCPTGMGYFDLIIARRVLQSAQAKGLGRRLSLWQDARWI